MKGEKLEAVRGSGIIAISGRQMPTYEQLKAILAAEIIKTLDRKRLSVQCRRIAQAGIAAADFSRIRNADLERFTDRSA